MARSIGSRTALVTSDYSSLSDGLFGEAAQPALSSSRNVKGWGKEPAPGTLFGCQSSFEDSTMRSEGWLKVKCEPGIWVWRAGAEFKF